MIKMQTQFNTYVRRTAPSYHLLTTVRLLLSCVQWTRKYWLQLCLIVGKNVHTTTILASNTKFCGVDELCIRFVRVYFYDVIKGATANMLWEYNHRVSIATFFVSILWRTLSNLAVLHRIFRPIFYNFAWF